MERERECFDIEGKKEGGVGTSDRLFYNQNNYVPDFSTLIIIITYQTFTLIQSKAIQPNRTTFYPIKIGLLI